MMKLHTNREYESELHGLQNRLVGMAELVQSMIVQSIQALNTHNVELAKAIIEKDHRVNQDEVDIDELCMVLLAKRQPMAGDLRLITQTLKMVTDLERIGDLAVNICERTIRLSQTPTGEKMPIPPMISQAADAVEGMLKKAVTAFVQHDAQLAEQVLKDDDAVDEIYHQMTRQLLVEMMNNPKQIECQLHIQAVAKWLERIGDHSTNLAEMVVFMVRGTDIRHAGKLDQIKQQRFHSTLH